MNPARERSNVHPSLPPLFRLSKALQAETQIQSCFRNYRSPNEEPCWLKMAGMTSSAFN